MPWIAAHKWGVWAFVVAVAFIPGIMSAALLPRWAAIVIGVPLVSRLTLERLSQAMQYVIVLGLSWAACSILFSPDPMAGALQFFYIVAVVGVFLAASELDSLDDAMTGAAVGIAVSSVISLMYLAGASPVEQLAGGHPAGLFYNSEVFAEFAAPVFLWTVLRKRWPLVLATALPMALCWSRVATLTVAIGLLYAFLPRSKLLATTLILGLVAACAAALVISPDKFSSAGLRFVIWGATLLAATPLGNGLGWFQAAHPIEGFAHSDAIQAAAELGLGCLLLAAIPVLIFREKRGTNVERAVFVAICVEVLVSFPLHVPGSAFVAAVVAGFLAGSRPPVFLFAFDGRTRDKKFGQWIAAASLASDGASRLGRRALSVRSAASPHEAMGYA